MNRKNSFAFCVYSLLILIPLFTGCGILDELQVEETPTKNRMQGTWVVTNAYDSADQEIKLNLNFPVTAFKMSSDNGVISTGGPMMMYLVYGPSKYTSIASTIDQVFKYTGVDFTNGEFFLGNGVVDTFTLEMKLEGLPGQKTLVDLLDILNINTQWLKTVVYHKFVNVSVNFENDTTMIWTLTNRTTARYNMKDSQGNYVLWDGWPAVKFQKCKFVLIRKQKTLKQLIDEANLQNNPEN